MSILPALMVEAARGLAAQLLHQDPKRLRHSGAVATAVKDAARRILPDEEDVMEAAGWLHDIGYGRSCRLSGMHQLDGALFLRDHGWPTPVVSLVAHHTCAWYEAEERQLLDRLATVPQPREAELDLLTWGDMTTDPSGAPTDVDSRVSEILNRYPIADPVHRSIVRSTSELRAAVHRTEVRLGEAASTVPRPAQPR